MCVCRSLELIWLCGTCTWEMDCVSHTIRPSWIHPGGQMLSSWTGMCWMLLPVKSNNFSLRQLWTNCRGAGGLDRKSIVCWHCSEWFEECLVCLDGAYSIRCRYFGRWEMIILCKSNNSVYTIYTKNSERNKYKTDNWWLERSSSSFHLVIEQYIRPNGMVI